MPRWRRATALAAWLAAAAGCGSARTVPEIEIVGDGGTGDPVALMDDAEDRRALVSEIAEIAQRADPEIRARAALAMGRIGDPAASPMLVDLLSDPSIEVRRSAAFAAGVLDASAPPDLVRAVLDRLAPAEDPGEIASLLDAVGRTGGAEAAARLADAVEDPRSAVRASAARALGLLGQRGIPVPDEAVSRIASLLEDPEEPVRFMAAFALYRIAEPSPGPAEAADALRRAASADGSAEVRAYAIRALARRGHLDETMLLEALEDADERVAATAASSLALLGDGPRCALGQVSLERAAARLSESPGLADGAFAHTARAALESVRGCDPASAIPDLGRRIEAALSGPDRPRSAGADRIRCLARLAAGSDDLALVSCAPERPWEGKRLLAWRLGRAAATSGRKARVLIEMIAEPDDRVAAAAIDALNGSELPEAREAILTAARGDRPIVVAAALDAVALDPASFEREPDGPDGPDAGAAPGGAIGAAAAAIDRFAGSDWAWAPLVSAAAALGALGDPAAEPLLARLARDPRPSVRGTALEAYRSVPGIDPPPLPPARPARPVPAAEKAAWRFARATAEVRTTRGTFVVRLRGDAAPAAVASFAELAAEGFFDGTEIHRVVPNFVVQAGDPTGTGLGDPGYALRCEVSPIPYERGTVGMALAGKDTGGSQFFVALSRQPHLDGRYTAFGEVVSGMDAVDLIEEGDRILGVSISAGDE